MVAAERGNLPSVLGGFSNQADKTHCIENAICCLSSKLVRASTRLKNNQHFSSSTLCLSIAVATLLVSSSVDAIEFTTPKTGHLQRPHTNLQSNDTRDLYKIQNIGRLYAFMLFKKKNVSCFFPVNFNQPLLHSLRLLSLDLQQSADR